jgi:hypothetical protein
MSNEAFAEHLGVAVRTVAHWRKNAGVIPRPAIQEALDTVFARAPDPVKAQFALILAANDAGRVGNGQPRDGANYRSGEMDPAVRASHEEWLAVRRNLRRHRSDLTHIVSGLYPGAVNLGTTGILMPQGWRLRDPIDLTAVQLDWREAAPSPAVTGQHEETRRLRPLVSPGQRYTRYHRAVRDLDRPRLFENRLCYRLADVNAGSSGSQVTLTTTLSSMCYFDMIDVGEALAHETALAGIDSQGELHPDRIEWPALPFRRLVSDPFALTVYPLMLSVSTLTVRRSPAGLTFWLLRRNPAKVAIAGGMLSVFPTGVFQPASVLPAPDSPDFDLWRNVMREYSEEYLGNPEHDGDGPPIDYASDQPFRSLDHARATGRIRILCLGIGIDALNYAGDIFTVAIFDSDVFDDIFGSMVQENDEGTVERQAYTFDHATITRLLDTEPLAPSGAACLRLAWEHRASIL